MRWAQILNTDTKKKILKLLAKEDMSPSDMAEKLKLSISNITRQISDMEKSDLIEVCGMKKGKTKSFKVYSIGKGFAYLVYSKKNDFSEEEIKIDEMKEVIFNIWKIPQEQYHYFIEKFWWSLQENLNDIDAIAVYGSVARGDARKDSDIDLLLLVNGNFKQFEKKFGSVFLKSPDEKRAVVMCQIFESKDFKNSIKLGSTFAKKILGDLIIIYDPKEFLRKLVKENG